jgi:PPOX class probable F420-dependent enzyme
MPSRRDAIRMTPGKERAYLESRRRIVLVTIGADGMPHPVPMNYGIDAEGRVLITSFRKSQKVRNLQRDPRATLLVESGIAYAELKAVILWCEVELIEDAGGIRDGMRQIRADHAMASSLSETMDEQVRTSLAKRVLLRFTPIRRTSWDHGKLDGFY